jgi:hypothetical protein
MIFFTSKGLMSTEKVARKFVQMCRENRRMEAIDELYSDKITSVELKGDYPTSLEGKLSVARKIFEWNASVNRIFDLYVTDPVINGDYFSFCMNIDALTINQERVKLKEVCVYKVQYGKIVFEQFFYSE